VLHLCICQLLVVGMLVWLVLVVVVSAALLGV
jgi:hypothetical protein